ncbi:MAG: DNA repair protein RecO [Saprospiraceae bacterium]|nr:DNA repair protein RecO [Saprospiraceae bacterium]
MIIKSRGIVFRHQRYGETSVISDIYTEEKGLQSYIVSGVRTRKSRVSPSLLQLMSLVDLVAYFREDRHTLNRIKEIRPAHTFQSIPFDLLKGTVGMFLIEVARKSIIESESNPNLFNFLYNTFLDLDQRETPAFNFHLGFLLELSGYLGFLPDNTVEGESVYFDLREGSFGDTRPEHPDFLNPELSLLFHQILNCGYQNSHLVNLKRPQRQELLKGIIDYYRLHIEHFPEIKSYKILEEVLG